MEGMTRSTWVLAPAVLAFALASAAYAQTPEDSLQSAYENLRNQQWVHLELLGDDTSAAKSVSIRVEAFWSCPTGLPKPLAQLTVESYRDEEPADFWDADGVQLWKYATDSDSYQAFAYGSFAGDQPTNYLDSLLQSLVAESRNPALFPNRLLRDVYGGPQALYKSWIPETKAKESSQNGLTTITYSNDVKTVTFTLDEASGDLKEIEYDAADPVRTEHWQMTVTTYDKAPTWQFTFTPPLGARPIALPSSSR
jgi:hypothetical protein